MFLTCMNQDTHLGGVDFDQRVMQHFMTLLRRRDGVDIGADKRALQKLRREVERVKRVLSAQHQARLEIDGLLEGTLDFSEPLTRARFEELNADLFLRTLEPVRRVLVSAGMRKAEVDEIVLVSAGLLLLLLFDTVSTNVAVYCNSVTL
jgi:heat shock protein 5